MTKSTSIRWKLPVTVFVTTILLVMFLIPTLIVIAFQNDNRDEQASTEQVATQSEPVEKQDLNSPIDVQVLRTAEDEVENVPLEEYVVHVVASEMPADFELEALKAQALAARTYIVRYLMQGSDENLPEGADVTDTVNHQVYKSNEELRQIWGSDYHWKIDKITNAVASTQGQIITYKQEPITPAFFSTSNGYTENSEDYWANELPYLRTVESPWDKQISPKFADQKTFPLHEVEEKLDIDITQQVQNFQIDRTESDRVATVSIGDQQFTGREVREALGLQSNDFTITMKNNHLVFTTKGYGHGVGMSQYGANGMAKEGKSYQEIVKHYYKGTNVTAIEQTASKLLAQEE
ncbi:stage II sporulation protein D [Gracilibacillus halophilus YIM-C55.5]|uniref:Stage II sporulation protein D n=1 Tax=Gracilibacillus halophilus YIM-C55.5 TaxID=1308866 RepID=N4WTZ1_9BACI|nr:stage II sporulation protein D [Gracilibacillus halophilus]ENH96561.1 stage II sporulation protein D [Gracilibacillus halophilus YIM-C55.5]